MRRVARVLAHQQPHQPLKRKVLQSAYVAASDEARTPLVLVEPQESGVVVVRLNRPKALNALGTNVRHTSFSCLFFLKDQLTVCAVGSRTCGNSEEARQGPISTVHRPHRQ